ncbi:hypothetical protein BT63DRAFT_456901 [Microthyrium microscopicum]|uniref:Uncharacterized protein n=1 Tax=Microthyrium microscopicum TaxID=703497 RepID=A0A6A6U5N0_9PEZI|nr:hypothetical protein BT63DRAFT_456901 [Microthyrium microscopicum]
MKLTSVTVALATLALTEALPQFPGGMFGGNGGNRPKGQGGFGGFPKQGGMGGFGGFPKGQGGFGGKSGSGKGKGFPKSPKAASPEVVPSAEAPATSATSAVSSTSSTADIVVPIATSSIVATPAPALSTGIAKAPALPVAPLPKGPFANSTTAAAATPIKPTLLPSGAVKPDWASSHAVLPTSKAPIANSTTVAHATPVKPTLLPSGAVKPTGASVGPLLHPTAKGPFANSTTAAAATPIKPTLLPSGAVKPEWASSHAVLPTSQAPVANSTTVAHATPIKPTLLPTGAIKPTGASAHAPVLPTAKAPYANTTTIVVPSTVVVSPSPKAPLGTGAPLAKAPSVPTPAAAPVPATTAAPFTGFDIGSILGGLGSLFGSGGTPADVNVIITGYGNVHDQVDKLDAAVSGNSTSLKTLLAASEATLAALEKTTKSVNAQAGQVDIISAIGMMAPGDQLTTATENALEKLVARKEAFKSNKAEILKTLQAQKVAALAMNAAIDAKLPSLLHMISAPMAQRPIDALDKAIAAFT